MVCEFPKLWAPASLYNFCTILKCIRLDICQYPERLQAGAVGLIPSNTF